MKTTFLRLATLAAFSALAAPAFADTYQLDPNHTGLYWHANHFGFSTPAGKFDEVKGTLELDEAKPEKSTLQVTINTASINTGIEKFNTHLKSPDFFNVEKFPEASFTSTKVEPSGKNKARVHGDLTLLGVTKPVILDVTLNKIGDNMMKIKTAGFSATTMVKRSEFGMGYGLPGVADDVLITIEVEANKG